MPLESSRRDLQLCIRLHPNQRSECGVILLQIVGVQTLAVLRLTLGSHGTKSHLDVGLAQNTIWGKVVAPPSSGRGESCESEVARGSS
jgi:hypothetical protein